MGFGLLFVRLISPLSAASVSCAMRSRDRPENMPLAEIASWVSEQMWQENISDGLSLAGEGALSASHSNRRFSVNSADKAKSVQSKGSS